MLFWVGTVFELRPANGGWTETVLYSFAGYPDGDGPSSGVILDKSGNLYGETGAGGSSNGGTVFKLSHSSNGWKEVLIYTFLQNQGDPLGGLVFDKTGNLYGATGRDSEWVKNVSAAGGCQLGNRGVSSRMDALAKCGF